MANITLFSNASAMSDLPPLPSYNLMPVKPLVPFIPDVWLSLILTFVAYWAISMFFHIIDVYDLFPQYRLHTPAEILNRNHVSRYEVARDVIIQQVIQTIVGVSLGLTEPPEMVGKESYDIATWATRLRIAQRALPQLLGLVGLNATAISKNLAGSHPMLAGALAGGRYPSLSVGLDVVSEAPVPAFAAWEIFTAAAIYWYIVPIIQFAAAIIFVDTWQYFLHRAMHMNKWLYSKSRVPFPRLSGLTWLQQLSTPDTTASTFLMRTEPSTITHSKDSSSIPSEQESHTR
jgi:sphinganine C4-monooxygenase